MGELTFQQFFAEALSNLSPFFKSDAQNNGDSTGLLLTKAHWTEVFELIETDAEQKPHRVE